MLPDCHDVFNTEHSSIACARSLTFGMLCLGTLAAAVFAFQQILPNFLRLRWYLTNLTMLALTGIQMALLVYECFIFNSFKVLVAVKYFRCVQVAISCVLYGKSAGELVNRTKLFYNILIPLVGLALIIVTADALLVVWTNEEVDCHHIAWMAMSITGVVLTAGFAIPGRIVLEQINAVTLFIKRKNFQNSAGLTELEYSHRQLWILLICNLVSTSMQLTVDVYLSLDVDGKKRQCKSIFFDDTGRFFGQLARLVISIGTYLVPNWGTLYVFFVLPRYQFSAALDVPGLVMDEECDEAAYQLLPNDKNIESSSNRGYY